MPLNPFWAMVALAQSLNAFSFICLQYIQTNSAEAEYLVQSALQVSRMRRVGRLSMCVYG